MKLALLGGTGPQGSGLAIRWAKAGLEVIVGSRQEEKAKKIADELNAAAGELSHPIVGMENGAACRAAEEFVVITVPFSAHRPTLEGLKDALEGKILVDVAVPLDPEDPKQMKMPKEGSAVEEAEAILGEKTRVIGALENISAAVLKDIKKPIHCDVLVCGRNLEARKKVMGLCERLGVKVYNAGGASSARCIEAITSLLIRMNISKQTPFHYAGIKIWPEETE